METTQELLKECFRYEDGKLIWLKTKTGKNCTKGQIAGCNTNNERYTRIGFNGKNYRLHQLVFLFHKGYIPKNIDHIDRDKNNNRIENLRDISHQQNIWNTGKRNKKNATSIYKGVCWCKQKKAFVAIIRVNGKQEKIGIYDNEIDAAKAYNEQVKIHFGEFGYLNQIQ